MNLRLLKRVLGYMKPYHLLLILLLVSSSVGSVLSLYSPILAGRAIDLIIEEGRVDFEALRPYLIRLAILVPLIFLSEFVMNRAANAAAYRTVSDLRRDLFSKCNRLPVSALDRVKSGEMLSRVTADADRLSDGLILGFAQFFSGIVTILATIGFMLSIHVPIALLVIVLTPISLLVADFIARRTYAFHEAQTKANGRLTALVTESITSLDEVKIFRAEEETKKQFRAANAELADSARRAVFFSSLTNPTTRFVNGLVYAAVGVVGGLVAISGGITVGLLSSFLTYANQYTKPFNEISGVFSELQASLASAARIFEVLDAEEMPAEDALPELVLSDSSICFDHVSFSYVPGKEVLHDISFSIGSGQRAAIVGHTGCGKTTLINLLMRFYEPDSGEIRVSGQPISGVRRESLFRQIGMVLQDTWLKEATVEENIRYGRKEATDGEIRSAAEKAHAASFIRRLAGDYRSCVGENGKNLSVGQRQLLCIARLMNRMPPILVLDEATSSIDLLTESQINSAFDEMMTGRTSIVVAHRLQTIKNADVILMMDAGRIIEVGSHRELMAKGGAYAALYNSQFASEEKTTLI